MGQPGVGVQNRGSTADYVLGTAEGWDAFQVVRWHGIEAISEPFQIDITLMRSAAQGPVDLDALLDADATFRVSTQSNGRPIACGTPERTGRVKGGAAAELRGRP